MSLNARYGFIKNGVRKAGYCHSVWCEYSFAERVIDFIKTTTIEEMNDIFDNLIVIDDETSLATEEQVKECEKYCGEFLIGHGHEKNEWYCLIREAQGSFQAFKEGLKYTINADKYGVMDYDFIIDLDNLIFYKCVNGKRVAEITFAEIYMMEE